MRVLRAKPVAPAKLQGRNTYEVLIKSDTLKKKSILDSIHLSILTRSTQTGITRVVRITARTIRVPQTLRIQTPTTRTTLNLKTPLNLLVKKKLTGSTSSGFIIQAIAKLWTFKRPTRTARPSQKASLSAKPVGKAIEPKYPWLINSLVKPFLKSNLRNNKLPLNSSHSLNPNLSNPLPLVLIKKKNNHL